MYFKSRKASRWFGGLLVAGTLALGACGDGQFKVDVRCLLASTCDFQLFTQKHDGAAPLKASAAPDAWASFSFPPGECVARVISEAGLVTSDLGASALENGAELSLSPSGPGDGYVAVKLEGGDDRVVSDLPILSHANGSRNYLLRKWLFPTCP